MKKYAKRSAVLALCLLLLVSLFAACGNGDTTEPPADTPEPVDTPAPENGDDTPPNEEQVTITYAMWGDENELRALEDVIVPRFMEEFPWINVEIIQVDRGEYETWMNTMAAAGTLPDTGIKAEPMIIPWAERGMLLPVNLDAIIEAVGDTPLPHLNFTWEGQPVATSVCNNMVQLFYNVDRFETAGVDAPPKNWQEAWSWDEFVDVAKSLTLDSAGRDAHDPGFDRNNVVQYGVRMYNATWMLEAWALANNGAWFDGPNNVTIDSEASVEAFQMIADLHLVHGVMPQFGTNVGTIQTWLIEDTAMAINGGWSHGVWLGPAMWEEDDDGEVTGPSGFRYNTAPLPRMAGQATIATAGANVTFATTEHPEAAAIWLGWYAQPENSWHLVETGIWMPIFSEWYHDEALMRRWSDNDYPGRASQNFPPFEDYRVAVIEYALSPVVHGAAWYTVGNMDVFLDILGTVLAPVWDGSQTAAEAIAAGLDALVAANRGG